MKPLAFVFLVLVGSMVLTSIPSQVSADPQLDSLLRIANQARDNIKIRLSQLATVPDEVAKLYKQASSETDALAQSVAREDTSSAKQHFLSAMKLFKQTSDMISSVSPPEPPLPPTDTSRLKNVIATMQNTADWLKGVAAKNNVNVDFTEFDNLMQTAKENLQAGNADQVTKTLEKAKQFLLDVYNSLSAAAKQKTFERAKDFAKQTDRVDKLMAQAKELEAKLDRLEKVVQDDDSRAKIAQTRDMFVNLKQLVSDGKSKEALQMIKSIDEILSNIDARAKALASETPSTPQTSKDTTKVNPKPDSKIEKIKMKIQTLEEQANNLSEKVTGNDAATRLLNLAFSLIEDAKIKLEKSPEKAMRTLNQVEQILHMIQRIT